MLTRFAAVVFSLVVMVLSVGAVSAQNYPTRPIRILAAEPGGGSDFMARIVASPLSNALATPVIVDNRASTLIGALGAKSSPDGYNLIIFGGGPQSLALTTKNPGYDPVKSFVGISQLERSPNILVVNPSWGVNSVKELIALAKAKPGTLNYGTAGTGGATHLAGEFFKMITGVDIVRVPYKGTGPALNGLLGNEVHMVFSTSQGALIHMNSGKLKALAVTSAQPTPLVPGVPTMAASGVPGYEYITASYIVVPVKTPAPIIKRLNQEIVRIMAQPDVNEKLLAGGTESVSSTPEQTAAMIAADDAKLRKLFAVIGITPQ